MQVDAAVVSSEAFACRTDVAVVDTAAFLRVGVELDGFMGTDPWAPLASRSTVPLLAASRSIRDGKIRDLTSGAGGRRGA